ncbi:MAG: Eco57I restriction-modification methylase domain-containing protein [Proteobacteria bacterium]|nr:Eco57I restriction-modification methylase domain-containing protein [Pseudomonadota bacterium]
MAIAKTEFSNYIKAFKFRELFNEMGWNNDRTRQPIVVDDADFNLVGIAEKSGFRIFICEPVPGNKLPDKATRKKIERKLTKLFQEHLIIFIDEYKREQVWQLAVRKAGSPTKISETSYSISQDPELLYQRASGLFFTLDEEEKVTIIDVTKRVAKNFQQNNERVTKKFYESFKKEHAVFLKFIQGLDDQLHMDWYASLMLNRLMFCYFIQKKGFLDNNKNYLQDKLKICKEKKGKNKFYSFYRDFLLALFHKGLGAPEQSRGDTSIALEIGKIPYLNGGLFDEHEIEKAFKNIQIDDKAFEKLFNFFDEYEWHLDTRETASGKDINPDVIGYIFEKYINDRAQMGAYYTKEDITDYIAQNCIIPWLFDEVKRHYPNAFAADGWLWQMVKTSGDEHIYDAVKYGIPQNGGLFDDMPDEIQKGFAPELENKVVDGEGPWLWEVRKSWNKPAPSDIALPTEIYREVIERRKRYADIKTKIESGEIKEINEFITCNLNIRQFAQDVVETTEDAEFIRHFYKAISSITILDPTCGSGAFLFAAMNILELLYEACIVRMKNFIDESKKGRHSFFEKTLAQVNAPEHPNLQYFIYKSIILNNLYGVDIMNEAVEIAKLRLFLKLVATVDVDYRKPNLGLEPLPDVDFNIRAGNTLVGYATQKQIDTIAGLFVAEAHKKKILEQCDVVARAFARYKEIQLSSGDDYDGFKKAKDDLNERLKKLTNDLDGILYMEQYKGFNLEEKEYRTWLATHQPFHWLAEFYEIIAGKGGFDVVIGNPPYVSYTKVRSVYKVQGLATEPCANLYAFVMERGFKLTVESGRYGMIVPIASVSTNGMKELQTVYRKQARQQWHSHFATRPGKLFVGVDMNLTITLAVVDTPKTEPNVFSTSYYRWRSGVESDRDSLFQRIRYLRPWVPPAHANLFPKIGNNLENQILTKLHSHNKKLKASYTVRGKSIYYHSGGRYWRKALFTPLSSHYKGVSVDRSVSSITFCLLNSQLFYWYWITNSNCMDVVSREVAEMPVFDLNLAHPDKCKVLQSSLLKAYSASSEVRQRRGAIISTDETNFDVKECKPIIDEIDRLLTSHYGFTHEELDFIINYDIKYRMGKELNSGEDNNG